MTSGPAVTVVDPRHPSPRPAPRPALALTRLERGLAVAVAALVLLGLVEARHLTGTSEGVVFRTLSLSAVVGEEGVLKLDLLLLTELPEQQRITAVEADAGWEPYGRLPPATGNGVPLSLRHAVTCEEVRLPSRVTVTTREGTRRVAVRAANGVRVGDSCNPFDPAVLAVSGIVIRAGERTLVRTQLVGLSTRELVVTGVRFRGFTFTATRPLPLALAARPAGPVVVDDLRERQLAVDATVADCGVARSALDGALGSGHPDRVALQLEGDEAAIDVPGIATYLDYLWRTACVR